MSIMEGHMMDIYSSMAIDNLVCGVNESIIRGLKETAANAIRDNPNKPVVVMANSILQATDSPIDYISWLANRSNHARNIKTKIDNTTDTPRIGSSHGIASNPCNEIMLPVEQINRLEKLPSPSGTRVFIDRSTGTIYTQLSELPTNIKLDIVVVPEVTIEDRLSKLTIL